MLPTGTVPFFNGLVAQLPSVPEPAHQKINLGLVEFPAIRQPHASHASRVSGNAYGRGVKLHAAFFAVGYDVGQIAERRRFDQQQAAAVDRQTDADVRGPARGQIDHAAGQVASVEQEQVAWFELGRR